MFTPFMSSTPLCIRSAGMSVLSQLYYPVQTGSLKARVRSALGRHRLIKWRSIWTQEVVVRSGFALHYDTFPA